MSLDFARVVALLQRLPAEARPDGALQVMHLESPFEPNPTVPTLILGVSGSTLPVVRRAFPDDQAVWVLSSEGEAAVASIGDLPNVTAEAIFVPAVEPETAERSLAGLRHVVHRLRAPGGCPWDREQTPKTLSKYVLEEAYEVVDAIEHHGPDELAEELGDLLLQVFLQSEIAEEAGDFGLNDVVQHLVTKLIRRHPHVFADVKVGGASDVEVNWEALKKAEKGERKSVLDGVPKSLPGLAMAAEIQKRIRKAGFKWGTRQEAEAKLAEELAELRDPATPQEAAAELGDVLFVLSELANWYGADAEAALRATNAKVNVRFRYVEEQAQARGGDLSDLSLDEMLALWREAKSLERQPA